MKIEGVHFHKRDRTWNANLQIDGKTEYLGSFKTKYGAMHAVYKRKEELGLDNDTSLKEHGRYIEWLKTRLEEVRITEKKIKNLKEFRKLKKQKMI